MTTLVLFGEAIDFLAGRVTFHHPFPEAFGTADAANLKEDLLQVTYPRGLLLDIGWYPEGDPHGEFMLAVVRDERWEEAREYRTRNPQELLRALRVVILELTPGEAS